MAESHHQCNTTQWTLVWQAASEDSDHGRPALEEIVRRYWKPLYGYARQRGFSPPDAEDATQEFLSNLLDRHWLKLADPAKGRFRAYLLTAWKRFLIDQYRKQNRQRRGGMVQKFSLDLPAAENAFRMLPSQMPDADHSFNLAWASSILEATQERLSNDYSLRGNLAIYQALCPFLTAPIEPETYQDLSKRLVISPSALRVALHRLRQRFGETLRQVVLETVDDPSEVDHELHELLKVLSSR